MGLGRSRAWVTRGVTLERKIIDGCSLKKLVFVATATVSVLLFGRMQCEVIDLKFFGFVKTKEKKIQKQ